MNTGQSSISSFWWFYVIIKKEQIDWICPESCFRGRPIYRTAQGQCSVKTSRRKTKIDLLLLLCWAASPITASLHQRKKQNCMGHLSYSGTIKTVINSVCGPVRKICSEELWVVESILNFHLKFKIMLLFLILLNFFFL